jgi:hypothetical protein
MPSLLGGLASAIVPLFTTSALAGTVGGQVDDHRSLARVV